MKQQFILFSIFILLTLGIKADNIEQHMAKLGYPQISIVIDDLGDNSIIAKKMLSLPIKMTAAILPHTPHARLISNFATNRGHDVIMHLPMEAFTRPDLLGPGALYNDMLKTELQKTFLNSAKSIPNIVGFNNHMGSLLTEDTEKMRWVMESAKKKGWFFLDSKTSQASVAQSVANELGLANIGRDIFLDHNKGHSPSLQKQFKLMKQMALRYGKVVVICHPYPETLDFLTAHLSELKQKFELVSISDIINTQYLSKKQSYLSQ